MPSGPLDIYGYMAPAQTSTRVRQDAMGPFATTAVVQFTLSSLSSANVVGNGRILAHSLCEIDMHSGNTIRSARETDGGGFEPPVPCGTHAFQACTIDRSVTHPDLRSTIYREFSGGEAASFRSLSATAPFQDLNFLAQLRDAAFRQHAAEIHVRINKTIAAEHRTGIDHRIAADFGSIADDRAELG
jgi:hypothetical protein